MCIVEFNSLTPSVSYSTSNVLSTIYRYPETRVMGHSRSMEPLDRLLMTSYWHFIVSVSIFCRFGDIATRSMEFATFSDTTSIQRVRWGDCLWIYPQFWAFWKPYSWDIVWWKPREPKFSCFDTMAAWQTDGRTNRQTVIPTHAFKNGKNTFVITALK